MTGVNTIEKPAVARTAAGSFLFKPDERENAGDCTPKPKQVHQEAQTHSLRKLRGPDSNRLPQEILQPMPGIRSRLDASSVRTRFSEEGSVRQLAPYSHIARPKGNGLFVVCGPGSMRQAQARNSRGMAALAYTGDMPPDSFRWPVMGFEITLINMGFADDFIETLTQTLLRSGATLIVVVSKWDAGASVHRLEELPDAA